MTSATPSIAIIGAGVGGLAVSSCLRKMGIETTIYEQASAFSRIGAGIQMTPNAMRVLDGIGVGEKIRAIAFESPYFRSRDFDTGNLTNEHVLGPGVSERYGAPYLLMHRGDLHAALQDAVPEQSIRYGCKLTGIDQSPRGVTLTFDNGQAATHDAVIASDGVHSAVRSWMLGSEGVHFTGRLAYRAVFPASLMNGYKMMGDACHPMTPYMAQGAASALEDSAVLARCLADGGTDDIPAAFARFEAARKPRTSTIQASSHRNEYMRKKTDPDWVYSYNAWTAELPAASD